MRLFIAILVVAFVLAAGCAQQGNAQGQAYDPDAKFVLPASGPSYHARYTVEEGGVMKKEVWRAPGRMRSDLSVRGQKALSFFFIDSRAYSCSYFSAVPSCYDITPTFSQADAARLAPSEAEVAGAMRTESVKIGGTDGECYETALGQAGTRKLCFAAGGIAAYDAYNVSREVAHTEYLTDLEVYAPGMGPDDSVFALPAAPAFAPVKEE